MIPFAIYSSRFHLDTEWFGWNSPFLFPGVFSWQKCITEDRGSRTLLLDGSGAGWRLRHSYDTAFGTFSGSEEGVIPWYLGSTGPPGPRMQSSPREMTALTFFSRNSQPKPSFVPGILGLGAVESKSIQLWRPPPYPSWLFVKLPGVPEWMRPHILAGFYQASAAGPLCEDV